MKNKYHSLNIFNFLKNWQLNLQNEKNSFRLRVQISSTANMLDDDYSTIHFLF